MGREERKWCMAGRIRAKDFSGYEVAAEEV